MRRVQPACINIVLTGYPAFENALRAIRAQVDDFLVKPAEVRTLVETIEQRLLRPEQLHHACNQRLADCLRENTQRIVGRALEHMKVQPRLARIPLSDQERIDHINANITEILQKLEGQGQSKPRASVNHGRRRKEQGYSLAMLVDDRSAIDSAIYDVVKEKLLELDLSRLLDDLARLNDCLNNHLQQSLAGFTGEEAA